MRVDTPQTDAVVMNERGLQNSVSHLYVIWFWILYLGLILTFGHFLSSSKERQERPKQAQNQAALGI